MLEMKLALKESQITVLKAVLSIKGTFKKQRMKTNRIFIVIFLCIFIGCKGNNIKDKSEKTSLSINDKSISSSQENKRKGIDNQHPSFVVSYSSGCDMRYSAENIIYNPSYIEVKFKVEKIIDGSSNNTDYETCLFYYDSLNEVSSVRHKDKTDNILEELPVDAQLSFKAFGKKLRENLPKEITNKIPLAKSNETLPYDKHIDIKTVKYNLIEGKLLKGASEFLCNEGDKLRYLPLPNKGDIYLILVPMDCGDFDYRFYLLSIKNNTIISNLYVEGIWFEPDSDESKEITSFRIDKNFSIKVKTTFIDSSQKVRTYIIRNDGKIIEK